MLARFLQQHMFHCLQCRVGLLYQEKIQESGITERQTVAYYHIGNMAKNTVSISDEIRTIAKRREDKQNNNKKQSPLPGQGLASPQTSVKLAYTSFMSMLQKIKSVLCQIYFNFTLYFKLFLYFPLCPITISECTHSNNPFIHLILKYTDKHILQTFPCLMDS